MVVPVLNLRWPIGPTIALGERHNYSWRLAELFSFCSN
jgi:hypothetical protein